MGRGVCRHRVLGRAGVVANSGDVSEDRSQAGTGSEPATMSDVVGLALPPRVIDALLSRWHEPHRRYHGETHLRSGLAALERLGGTRLERIAFWCHDAVHTNTTPSDELASVEIARDLLDGLLPASDLEEVCRLILVTIDHAPAVGDASGARISDADLVGLSFDLHEYEANVAGIRAELPGLTDDQWRERRLVTVTRLSEREPLFCTEFGRSRWEPRARENLARERAVLERH